MKELKKILIISIISIMFLIPGSVFVVVFMILRENMLFLILGGCSLITGGLISLLGTLYLDKTIFTEYNEIEKNKKFWVKLSFVGIGPISLLVFSIKYIILNHNNNQINNKKEESNQGE